MKSAVKCLKLLPVLMISVLLFAGCSGEDSNGEEKKSSRQAVKYGLDVPLKEADGGYVSMSSFKGEILAVNFIMSWNRDSRKLIPLMNKLQREFGGNVTIIGILMDEDFTPAGAKAFISDYHIKFPLFINGEQVVNSFGGANTLPTTYIISKMGNVVERIDGLKRKDYYKKQLVTLLSLRR